MRYIILFVLVVIGVIVLASGASAFGFAKGGGGVAYKPVEVAPTAGEDAIVYLGDDGAIIVDNDGSVVVSYGNGNDIVVSQRKETAKPRNKTFDGAVIAFIAVIVLLVGGFVVVSVPKAANYSTHKEM